MGHPCCAPEQWQSIREHLATVFDKRTPEVGAPIGLNGGPYTNEESNAQQKRGADLWPTEEVKDFIDKMLKSQESGEPGPFKLDEHTRIIC